MSDEVIYKDARCPSCGQTIQLGFTKEGTQILQGEALCGYCHVPFVLVDSKELGEKPKPYAKRTPPKWIAERMKTKK